jgi:hypothetical protein
MAEAFCRPLCTPGKCLQEKEVLMRAAPVFAPASGILLAELNTLKANAGLYRKGRFDLLPFRRLPMLTPHCKKHG